MLDFEWCLIKWWRNETDNLICVIMKYEFVNISFQAKEIRHSPGRQVRMISSLVFLAQEEAMKCCEVGILGFLINEEVAFDMTGWMWSLEVDDVLSAKGGRWSWVLRLDWYKWQPLIFGLYDNNFLFQWRDFWLVLGRMTIRAWGLRRDLGSQNGDKIRLRNGSRFMGWGKWVDIKVEVWIIAEYWLELDFELVFCNNA